MISLETLSLLWPRAEKKGWPHPARQTFRVLQEGDPEGTTAFVCEDPSEGEVAQMADMAGVPAHDLRIMLVGER